MAPGSALYLGAELGRSGPRLPVSLSDRLKR
jgi:hypothetical protein